MFYLWDIELFFKWIKQNLKIKRFISTTENAVKIQIASALILFLLLRLIQLQTQSKYSITHIKILLASVLYHSSCLTYLLGGKNINEHLCSPDKKRN